MAAPYLDNPCNWEVITLEADSANEMIQSVDSGGTPSTTNDANWDGGIPWLTPKEITRNDETLFVSHTERTISEEGLATSAAKLLRPETVMLTKRAPVGAVAINSVPMTTNQGFLTFRCGNQLRPLYLAHWLRGNTRYLQQVANGSTYRELYKTDLFEFQLAVPSIDEQDAILSAISALQYVSLLGVAVEQSVRDVDAMLSLQAQSLRLATIRKSLLLQLLSGHLSVSDVDDWFGEK